jgi:hypothetical protein
LGNEIHLNREYPARCVEQLSSTLANLERRRRLSTPQKTQESRSFACKAVNVRLSVQGRKREKSRRGRPKVIDGFCPLVSRKDFHANLPNSRRESRSAVQYASDMGACKCPESTSPSDYMPEHMTRGLLTEINNEKSPGGLLKLLIFWVQLVSAFDFLQKGSF